MKTSLEVLRKETGGLGQLPRAGPVVCVSLFMSMCVYLSIYMCVYVCTFLFMWHVDLAILMCVGWCVCPCGWVSDMGQE